MCLKALLGITVKLLKSRKINLSKGPLIGCKSSDKCNDDDDKILSEVNAFICKTEEIIFSSCEKFVKFKKTNWDNLDSNMEQFGDLLSDKCKYNVLAGTPVKMSCDMSDR